MCYVWCLEESHVFLSILSSIPVIKLELQWFLDKGCIVVNIQHWADYIVVLWKRERSIQEIGIPDLQLLALRNGSFWYKELCWSLLPWSKCDAMCLWSDQKRPQSSYYKARVGDKCLMTLRERWAWTMIWDTNFGMASEFLLLTRFHKQPLLCCHYPLFLLWKEIDHFSLWEQTLGGRGHCSVINFPFNLFAFASSKQHWMAESQEDLEEHTHQSVIRGHHIYKDINFGALISASHRITVLEFNAKCLHVW